MSRRVAVTGIGVVSAIGADEATFRERLLAGRGGIAALRPMELAGLKASVAAQVDGEVLAAPLEALGRVPTDRALDMALAASAQALAASGWLEEGGGGVAVLLGTGMGPAETFFDAYTSFFAKGLKGLRPTTVPRAMYNALSSAVSIQFGLTGTNFVVVSACASATHAFGAALRMIRHGYADRVLCGGAEAFFNPLFFAAWNNLGVLSRGQDPATACRPFDRARDGCVLGEGAGVLALESLERATARGAAIRGELLGYGETSDASHITRPSPENQAQAMREALADAGVAPAELAYVNAHGTATRSNDRCEAASLAEVLGEATAQVPVGACKSYFGHTLGASGALETIATLLALEAGRVPPNLNLEHPDEECGLRLVGATAEPLDGALAMKNSFGFGGGNAVLILGRGGS